MRILTTLLMLLATVLPGLAATTYPAATNAPNIFFQTNTFLTNTYFGLPRTNVIGTAGSAINGVGFTNGAVTAFNINSVTNFDTRAWTNSSGDLYIGASPNSANLYFWNDGDNEYRHVYTAGGQYLSFDANLSVTGQVNFKGGTVSAPLLTSSSTSNAPSALELASAGWVRSLFNNGVLAYTTTNIDATATNIGSGQPMYTFASAIPASGSRTYTAPTSGSYIGSVMTTNTFSFIQGPIDVSAYLAAAGGSGGPSVSVHPEIYYSYDKTNWYGDWDSQNQTITIGATNLYQFVVSFPAVTATNSAGFYLQRRFKIGTATGATKPNVIFLIGTNIASGVANASHISFSGPNSSYGNAYLANNQTWTGTNTFNGNTIFTAPVSFDQLDVNTMIVTNGITASNLTVTGYFITPTNTPTDAYVLTATGTGGASAWKEATSGGGGIATNGGTGINNMFTNVFTSGMTNQGILGTTNLMSVGTARLQFGTNGDPVFYLNNGKLLWNTDGGGDIGANGANRPTTIYTQNKVVAGGAIDSADNVVCAATKYFGFSGGGSSGRGYIAAPADGTLGLMKNGLLGFEVLLLGAGASTALQYQSTNWPALRVDSSTNDVAMSVRRGTNYAVGDFASIAAASLILRTNYSATEFGIATTNSLAGTSRLVVSNNCLYFVTATKTNLIVDGN